jgi:hypothetical protein
MLGLMLWPLIRDDCLIHDKYYRLCGVNTVPLPGPKSHFGAGYRNIDAVPAEVDRFGIPRRLYARAAALDEVEVGDVQLRLDDPRQRDRVVGIEGDDRISVAVIRYRVQRRLRVRK